MENNKEEQLNDKQLKEVSGGQEALNSWVDEPVKKREEVLKAIEELMNCFKPKHQEKKMTDNKEKQLNDEKLEEVSGGTDSDADEMMEGPLKVYHTIQDVIETIKNAFENQDGKIMSDSTKHNLNDEDLIHVNGGEDMEIIFGAKDLSSNSAQTIQSYAEPASVMNITPFVENSVSTINKYNEPVTHEYDVEKHDESYMKDISDYQKRPGGH